MSAVGLVVGIIVLAWVVIDPTGAAGAVVHVAHQLGVMASSLTHYLSTHKAALNGVSTANRSSGRPA